MGWQRVWGMRPGTFTGDLGGVRPPSFEWLT